jgi:uncharacterized membrane protein YkoI
MKNSIHPLILIFSFLTLFSCNESSENKPDVPQSVIDKSLNLFEGEVVEKELETEDGVNSWEVKIEDSNGSVLKIYWSVSNEALVKMEGEKGPFDYEIVPGMGLINYSAAKTFAIAAVKNNAIIGWKLQKEDSFINKWVYTFEMEKSGGTTKVYIDAENGDVLQTD